MTPADLQAELKRLGTYADAIDGRFGPKSKTALVNALALGPQTPLSPLDIENAAAELGCDPEAVEAVLKIEAAGAGFQDGRPKILPEPYRFHLLTHGKFSTSDPDVSSPFWNRALYKPTQLERYAQLATMVGLDVDAGLQAASWGLFQVMGENFRLCGFARPWDFVWAMAQSERDHLNAFAAFVTKRGLKSSLQNHRWEEFACGYNGPGQVSVYSGRLKVAYQQLVSGG